MNSVFKYPTDLVPLVRRQWSDERRYRDPAGLPSDRALSNLFETVFHASLLAEEGRQLSVHVIFATPEFFDSSNDAVVTRTIPLALSPPRKLSVAELLRLVPAVDPWASAILVCEPTIIGSEPEDTLVIWGILNLRSGWERHLAGTQSIAYCPPKRLAVTSGAPGSITVGAGGDAFATLEHGSIHLRKNKWVRLYSLLPAFDSALTYFDSAAAKCFGLSKLPQSERNTYWSQFYYHDVLRRLLFIARSQGHGACFLIAPPKQARDAVEQGQIVLKYATPGLSLTEALIFGVANRLANSAKLHSGELRELYELPVQFALITFPNTLNPSLRRIEEEWTKSHSTFGTDIDESVWDVIDDCCRSIANFSQVDGAVLMTDQLEVLGFGSEIRTEKGAAVPLKRAYDWNIDRATPVSADSYGMRHRSAFQFCMKFRGAVALIVSQDGDMKLVCSRQDDLLYWDITPPGVYFD
ncbi:MAG: putative sensor domain DACNV-containing protein [Terracidiphilus sp.]